VIKLTGSKKYERRSTFGPSHFLLHASYFSSVDITRRRFTALAGGTLAAFAFGEACGAGSIVSGNGGHRRPGDADGDDGRLAAKPRDSATTAAAGAHALGLDRGRDAMLQLPPGTTPGPLPLLVLFHGAGGSGEAVLRRFAAAADEAGVAVLAPSSRGPTWDAIRDGFGPDIPHINRALERVFDTVSIDPARIAAGGFSDGATYALSLGLINGDLFRRVAAFSPGFIVDGTAHGRPRFFVSHGTADPILPIDRCSRVIVPALRRRGYEVTFREFEGVHQVPPEIAREGMKWLADKELSK
jgi:phospholipase/carboxylesterase